MGLIAHCDGGCGATATDLKTFTPFGIVKKVWYCKECASALRDLYVTRDERHTKAAADLNDALLDAVYNFNSVYPKMRLPDAPE